MRLSVEAISHHYGDTEVLRNVSLTVEAGRITCLIGPSGCGKSTLLRIIGGLERPSSGRVMLDGTAAAGSLNPLTYVFQDFALLPWRSAAGNISLALEGHGLSAARREAIIADVLARTRLTEFADALPRQLSGGMRQRVAIARALAVSPEVMLMDEPLSALDAQTRELLMDDLVGLWTRQNFSAVYVTHNLAEAVRMGHQIVILSRRPGQIREVVEVDMPLAERATRMEELAPLQRRLWEMMRDEAAAADRELSHG